MEPWNREPEGALRGRTRLRMMEKGKHKKVNTQKYKNDFSGENWLWNITHESVTITEPWSRGGLAV